MGSDPALSPEGEDSPSCHTGLPHLVVANPVRIEGQEESHSRCVWCVHGGPRRPGGLSKRLHPRLEAASGQGGPGSLPLAAAGLSDAQWPLQPTQLRPPRGGTPAVQEDAGTRLPPSHNPAGSPSRPAVGGPEATAQLLRDLEAWQRIKQERLLRLPAQDSGFQTLVLPDARIQK